MPFTGFYPTLLLCVRVAGLEAVRVCAKMFVRFEATEPKGVQKNAICSYLFGGARQQGTLWV